MGTGKGRHGEHVSFLVWLKWYDGTMKNLLFVFLLSGTMVLAGVVAAKTLPAKSLTPSAVSNISSTPTPSPTTLIVTNTPSLSPSPSKTTEKQVRCIVTLFGNNYDVTELRSSHSGGDIFKCGIEMTSVYQKQHGTDLKRVARYQVSNETKNTMTSTGNTDTRRVGEREDDD